MMIAEGETTPTNRFSSLTTGKACRTFGSKGSISSTVVFSRTEGTSVCMKDGEVVQVGTPEEILTDPANAYVTRFTESVDRGRIVTASSIMLKQPIVVRIKRVSRSSLGTLCNSRPNETLLNTVR